MAAGAALAKARATPAFALDLMTRDGALAGLVPPQLGLSDVAPVPGTVVTLTPGALHFDAARLDAPAAAQLAARVAHAAGALAEKPADAPLSTVSALSATEAQQVLQDWNATLAPRFPDLCVHTSFEVQAAKP